MRNQWLVCFGLLSSIGLTACFNDNHSRLKDSETTPSSLGLNDLAILMPLHTVPELIDVLPRLNQSHEGKLRYVHDWAMAERNQRLGIFEPKTSLKADEAKDFILTSIRIDPCSNELQNTEGDASCVRELRLVWQRLDVSESGALFAGDSNVHTLYTLSHPDFSALILEMKKLSKEASLDSSKMSLRPHPVIEKEGALSPYLAGVLKLFDTYALPESLSEIASFAADNPISWKFSHLAVADGNANDMPIPALFDFQGNPSLLESMTQDPSGDFSTLTPKLESAIPQMPLLGGRGGIVSNQKIQSIVEGKLRSSFAIENPRLHNPKNTNCTSCHIASHQARFHEWAVNRFSGEFPALENFKDKAFSSSRFDLSVNFSATGSSLQIFSFGGQKNGLVPVIAPRVVNDTAASLEYLEGLINLD